MGESILEANHLNYSISNLDILKDINFKVKKDTFVGIIGPNGSGKTTLLKHFYRSILPKPNTIWLKGEPLENYTQAQLAQSVTVMKQENLTEFDYTVYQMVLMGRAPYIKPYEGYGQKDKEISNEALIKTGMMEKKDRFFSVLSGGEKQRVLIARSLAQQTEILLLDEPTNHLDIFYQLYLMQMISHLNKTVISVFHDLNLAAKFCDYIYVLHLGKIVAHGRTDEILTAELLKEYFKVNALVQKEEGGNAKNILYRDAIVQ